MLCAWLLWAAAATARAAPKNPDTLIWASRSDESGIDPARTTDVYARAIQSSVYDTVVSLSSPTPTASNGLVSPDGLTWRFPLRGGVRFHDGSPVTAEDERYSLARMLVIGAAEGKHEPLQLAVLGSVRASAGPEAAREALRLANEAVAVRDGALELRLRRRAPLLAQRLAADGMVLSKAWALAHGEWDGTEEGVARFLGPDASRWLMTHADGSGPFRLERWDQATREIVLERYDGYWRGPARLRRVLIMTVPELATRVLMLKNGDADLISAGVGEESAVSGLADVDVSTGLQAAVRWPAFEFNFKVDAAANPDLGSGRLDGEGVPPDFFADRDVRLGFAYAFDPQAYIDGFLRGRGRLASGVVPPGIPGYSASGLEFRHDRARAERHFRRAWGGRVWKNGFTLKVVVNRGSAVRPAIMAILQAELAAINPKFHVESHVVDWSTFLASLHQGRVALAIGGEAEAVADPFVYLRSFYHSAGEAGHALHFSDPRLDRLIERAETEPDPARRLALIDQAQRLGAREAPVVILAEPHGDTLRVSRRWVKGYRFDPFFPGAPDTSDFYALWKE